MSSLVIGLWSIVIKPEKPYTFSTPATIQVTNASLGEELADENGRSVIKLTYDALKVPSDDLADDDDGEVATHSVTTALCALTAGKTESSTVSLVLENEMEYTFEVSGKNTVYLSGNYIDQEADQPPSDDEFDSEDEDAFDLREVSSDVEMHPDDLADLESDASRFEEVEDEVPPKGQKRPRDSDKDGKQAEKPEKKNKKLKGEDGKPVEAEGGKVAEGQKADKKEKKKEKKETKDEKPAQKTTPGGVVFKDTKVGTGPMAKKGNTVMMRYKGRLQNGKIFDENVKGKPFTFHLGKGEVIKGWDEGILGMQPGGERLLTIPPQLGYGKRGTEGIPGNSTLIFEVKLLEIK